MNFDVGDWRYDGERHPYNKDNPAPDGTKTLIVGTAPPPRFSNPGMKDDITLNDARFYYGSEDNYLWWEIFEEINKEIEGRSIFSEKDWNEENCVATMKCFLTKHKIWMRDVLENFKRKNQCSAADDQIARHGYPEFQYADFSDTFGRCGFLTTIAFTSEKAAEWTFDALREQKLMALEIKSNAEFRLEGWKALADPHVRYREPCFSAIVGGRKINFFILPTPTGRSRAGITIPDKICIYKDVLFTRRT